MPISIQDRKKSILWGTSVLVLLVGLVCGSYEYAFAQTTASGDERVVIRRDRSSSSNARTSTSSAASSSGWGLNERSIQKDIDGLVKYRRQQREIENFAKRQSQIEINQTAPPVLEDLTTLKKGGKYTSKTNLPDDPVGEGLKAEMDLRKEAQREAALSYGARGGLAHRNYEIMQRVEAFGGTLDNVFNFRALLIQAPSGMLIEPPIIRESLDSMVITEGGNEAAVADRVLDINKQAKIVSAPRDWREYLLLPWTSNVPPPPEVLWPENAMEQARWDEWVRQGWGAGVSQADDMYDANLNRLTADYRGMVRYRMLLAEGVVSQPYALHEDRGVTGTATVLRVGDRALRITGPTEFLRGWEDTWKPADR